MSAAGRRGGTDATDAYRPWLYWLLRAYYRTTRPVQSASFRVACWYAKQDVLRRQKDASADEAVRDA